MFTKRAESFEIHLGNAEGIPVLLVGGNITRTAIAALRSIITRLAEAGHYHIVLNIERVQTANWHILADLAGSIKIIHSHYGAVDLVAGSELIQQLMRNEHLSQLFRLCQSENQAISRIKGLQRQPDRVSRTSARLMEKI